MNVLVFCVGLILALIDEVFGNEYASFTVGDLSKSELDKLEVEWIELVIGELGVFQDPIIRGTDVMSVVQAKKGVCLIKVEGSTTVEDWMHNLKFYSSSIHSLTCKGKCKKIGKGMNGFVKAYNGMKDDMWEQMMSKCHRNDTFVFSGHSRGATIASTAASVAYLEGLVPSHRLKLVTLGGPRVLSHSLSDKVHDKFVQYRLVNKKDPIPSVPYPLFGFKHFGKLVYNCNTLERCLDGRDEPKVQGFFKVADHYLASYRKWIIDHLLP